MDDLHFHASIRVGWVVTLRAGLAAFRSSMEVGSGSAENPLTGEQHLTTTALITFVALEPDGSRAQVPPSSSPTTSGRRSRAHARRRERLSEGSACSSPEGEAQVENDVPQPQVDLAFGFSNLNPAAVVPTT